MHSLGMRGYNELNAYTVRGLWAPTRSSKSAARHSQVGRGSPFGIDNLIGYARDNNLSHNFVSYPDCKSRRSAKQVALYIENLPSGGAPFHARSTWSTTRAPTHTPPGSG
jgi:hypothetical protein